MGLQDMSCHVDNNNKLKFGSSKSTPPFSLTGQLDREYRHCSVNQCFIGLQYTDHSAFLEGKQGDVGTLVL